MSSDLVLRQQLQEQGLLDRFSDRAIQWADQLGIRWIELEGELWTLVSELERKKGVEAGDFVRDSRLKTAHEVKPQEPPAALQRLLQVPGVRKASIPTTFEVEGGYALSCGGPGAKAGITALVRQQIPKWALAGYTLVNVPLALSYLQHGRSDVAKATRDLTIGTTIDVGKAAAAREAAPLAVHQLAGSPQFNALFLRMVQMLGTEAQTAQLTADRAEAKADHADEKAEKALQLSMHLSRHVLAGKKTRAAVQQSTREKLWKMWNQYFYGECPCCHKPVSGEQGTLEVDHFWDDTNQLENLWLVCKQCNHRMGKPGRHRSRQDKQRHDTWLDRCGLDVVQRSFWQ